MRSLFDASLPEQQSAVQGRFLRDVWYGRKSLPVTFWVWWTFVGLASFGLVLAGGVASAAAGTVLPIFLALLVVGPLQVWAWVGTWRSATRRGGGWAIAAKVAVVAAVINAILTPATTVQGLLRARAAGNQASAIGSLRAIASAQVTYQSVCGGSYAPSLGALATPPEAGAFPFISPDLSSDPSIKSGYTITLVAGEVAADAPTACNQPSGRKDVRDYFASAVPNDASGVYFALTSDGSIYQSPSPIPPTFGTAPPLPAVPLQ